MAGTRILPKGAQFWPAQTAEMKSVDVIRLYEQGFAGAYSEPEEKARFESEMPNPFGAAIAHANGWAGSAAGQLVAPFAYADRVFPGCWPGPAQTRGDCVSHSTKNAGLLTLICEIFAGQPDPISGLVEGAPELSPTGIQQGVLSTEAIYWWRRHGGDGWSCDASVRVICKESGLWLRKNYPELNVDLTSYSGRTAGLYGSRTPPESFAKVGQEHLVRDATALRSFEEVRDFLANGYGVTTCGSEGFSSSRNEDGVSSRQGSWAHAMAAIGADDRDVVKQKYGEPLVLILNSWGRWNSGPRTVLGTGLQIPEGAFWARWSHVRNRSFHALSSVAGWPARRLPTLGAKGNV